MNSDMKVADGSIILEMDIKTVGRLIQSKAVSVEDIHSVDSRGKRRLRGLLLELLRRELNFGQATKAELGKG